MVNRLPAVLVAALLLWGCGDDGGALTTTVPATTTTAALECPTPIEVSDAAEVLAVLAATEWVGAGLYSSGHQPITPDLVVTGSITIDGAEVVLPRDCLDRDDCGHEAGFAVSGTAVGVTVTGTADPEWYGASARVTLTDTTVRFRQRLVDTHPGPLNAVPVISVYPRCGSLCAEGSALCPADGVCYGTGGDTFCRLCEGRSVAECACRDATGPLPDGESCEYFVSGDVIEVGTCRRGVCERDE